MKPFKALNAIENDHPLPLIYHYRSFAERFRGFNISVKPLSRFVGTKEANATRAVETLKKGGIAGTVRREESQGKPLWSVTTRGDAAEMTKVKGLGFPDAYFLKR
mgnify:CR=1 FL=1